MDPDLEMDFEEAAEYRARCEEHERDGYEAEETYPELLSESEGNWNDR